jgi:hypothetical protein
LLLLTAYASFLLFCFYARARLCILLLSLCLGFVYRLYARRRTDTTTQQQHHLQDRDICVPTAIPSAAAVALLPPSILIYTVDAMAATPFPSVHPLGSPYARTLPPTNLPELDAMPSAVYLDAAIGRLSEALDRRDALAANTEQLALLSAVESDLFGRGSPRPERQTLLVAAARFWGGLAQLAGSRRVVPLMTPPAAADWLAGPAAWPPTAGALARFLSRYHEQRDVVAFGAFVHLDTLPGMARSIDSHDRGNDRHARGQTTAATTTNPNGQHLPIELQRVDALLGWLAVDLDARLCRLSRSPPPSSSTSSSSSIAQPYAPASTPHSLWRACDQALGRIFYLLTDEPTCSPRASACVDYGARSTTSTVAPLPSVAPHAPWSGASLGIAFVGLTGAPGGPDIIEVPFVRLPAALRRVLVSVGAAALPIHRVRVPAGAMLYSIERGHAVWASSRLREAIEAHTRPAERRRVSPLLLDAASTIYQVIGLAIEAADLSDACLRRVRPSAGRALMPPFWEAARLFGVAVDSLVSATPIEAATVAATAAHAALGF